MNQLTIPMHKPGSRHSGGFTIVEAMIGLALSSAIMLGVSQLFVANSQTYKLLVGQSMMQESGRFALGAMARSVQQAGYRGCFSSNDSLYKTFLVALPYEYDILNPIVGFDGKTTNWLSANGTAANALPKSDSPAANVYPGGTGIDHTTIKKATDIFTSNYLPEKKHQLSSVITPAAAPVYVGTTDFDFVAGELAMIHDCEKQTVFQISGITGNAIAHATGGGGVYANTQAGLPAFGDFETDDSYISPIVSETYFIAPSGSVNKSGLEILSLWRKTGFAAPVELVDGIEDLQVEYGVDSTADRIPNKYVPADGIGISDVVVAVRLTVVANSVDDVGGTSDPTHYCRGVTYPDGSTYPNGQQCPPDALVDGLLRRTSSQTIALHNG